MKPVPNFRYRALTQSGDVVSGSITAPNSAEVMQRIEFLGLVPIDSVADEAPAVARAGHALFNRPRAEDVTTFTRDLALLLKAGAHIDDALELMATDIEMGRLRRVVAEIRAAILAGESFAEALSHRPAVFPSMYVALVQVGEASGTLADVLELIAQERARAESLRRRIADALRYPAFVLVAAGCVLVFFLMFVLPQFATVLRDFNAKLDPLVVFFLGLSDILRAHGDAIAATLAIVLAVGWLTLRRPGVRSALLAGVSRLPLVRWVFAYHRAALFCRNLGVLLGSGVAMTTALRILSGMMAEGGDRTITLALERVRQGGKLSDALSDCAALPLMAIRMLRLGEETGQLPVLAGRVAEFYESKLQRSLERIVGIVGPLAIVAISIVVGGLIVSVMTSLLSVSQVIG